MNVTSKITVDMTRQNVGQRINAVQGDGNTRLVEITLLSGGAPWTPPEGVEAAIAYMQPGGTKGLYNKLADGTAAISISGNVAMVILAPQMLAVSGTVQASLVFNDAQLNRLTTFPFAVSVTSNPAAGAQKVEDYLRLQWLEEKLEGYLAAIKASGVFDGKPGDNGVTFTPSVSENGDLSWRNNGGLPNPQTVNLRGPQGDSTAATAAANAAKTSAANAETHAAYAAASAAAAQATVGAMGTELSQIKDDLANKLPKSPADWEAWTAEEQAAARGRIGADGGEMELIAEVTTTEELDVISVSNFPDGTQLKLKSFMIYFVIPKASSDSHINSGYKMNYGNNLSINRDSSNNLIKSGFNTHNNMYVLWNNARPIGLVTKSASWANGSAEIESVIKYDNYSDGNANYISEVHLSKYTNGIKIPSGTMLKLYGVRV